MGRTVTLYHEGGGAQIEVPEFRVEQMKSQGWTDKKPGEKKSASKERGSEK